MPCEKMNTEIGIFYQSELRDRSVHGQHIDQRIHPPHRSLTPRANRLPLNHTRAIPTRPQTLRVAVHLCITLVGVCFNLSRNVCGIAWRFMTSPGAWEQLATSQGAGGQLAMLAIYGQHWTNVCILDEHVFGKGGTYITLGAVHSCSTTSSPDHHSHHTRLS